MRISDWSPDFCSSDLSARSCPQYRGRARGWSRRSAENETARTRVRLPPGLGGGRLGRPPTLGLSPTMPRPADGAKSIYQLRGARNGQNANFLNRPLTLVPF